MVAKLDVIDLTKHFEEPEKRFTFLINALDEIYTNTKEEFKKQATKVLVTRIVELFSHEDSVYRSDPRLLRAWDILGRTSNSMGYDAIMQRLDSLGYFKASPEFYHLWATYLVEKKNLASFETLNNRVRSQFPYDKDLLKAFTNMSVEIGFTNEYRESDKTENIFGKIGKDSIARAPLSAINNKEPVASPPPHVSHQPVIRETAMENDYVPASPIDEVVPAEKSASPVSAPSPPPSSSATTAPAANYSFTTHLYKNACDAFGYTLPLSQEMPGQQQQQPSSQTTANNHFQKDFSVFQEEDENEISAEQSKRPYTAARIIAKSIVKESPVAKKKRRDSLEDIEVLDNPFGDAVGITGKKSLSEKMIFDNDKLFDDLTISGMNKQSSSRASSTPTGGKPAAVPTFEVSPTACFAINKPTSDKISFSNESDAAAASPSLPPLSHAINRMSIAPNDDLDETTHDIAVMPEVVIKTGINPWTENEHLKILRKAPPMVEQHEFLNTKCPSFNGKNNTIDLGGEKFKILKFIAQGGFARIYKTQNEEGKQFAIKLEMPSCPWEVYICKALSRRIHPGGLPFVMTIRDAFIFSNASAIVYEYYPMKTLLDLANAFKQDCNSAMDGMLTAFVGVQIAETLNYIHQAKIIHADCKPDNFVIVRQMGSDLPQNQYTQPFVKLIDFGRAIDMHFYDGQTFKGRAGTEGFNCHEMLEDRPWTYQTDYFGFVGTMHVLMFNCYMKTFFHDVRKNYCFTEQLKRRYPLCDTWMTIFRDFLNIPSCEEMPSWETAIQSLKQDLEDFATEDVNSWRRATDKCNAILRKTIS